MCELDSFRGEVKLRWWKIMWSLFLIASQPECSNLVQILWNFLNSRSCRHILRQEVLESSSRNRTKMHSLWICVRHTNLNLKLTQLCSVKSVVVIFKEAKHLNFTWMALYVLLFTSSHGLTSGSMRFLNSSAEILKEAQPRRRLELRMHELRCDEIKIRITLKETPPMCILGFFLRGCPGPSDIRVSSRSLFHCL